MWNELTAPSVEYSCWIFILDLSSRVGTISWAELYRSQLWMSGNTASWGWCRLEGGGGLRVPLTVTSDEADSQRP